MDDVMTETGVEPVKNGHDETLEVVPDEGDSTIDATNGVQGRTEQLVPVSEAKRYRKRAQSAEKLLGELREELEHSRQELAERDHDLAQMQRRQAIDAALQEHGAIDSETARLVLEQVIEGEEQKDVREAVVELARRKPFLFRTSQRVRTASTLGPRLVGEPVNAKLETAAVEAITTGKRSDVLKYLRLRRKT